MCWVALDRAILMAEQFQLEGDLQRWRTERIYEDLKGELGFDHYEGRSFPGWNHHVSVVLCCYAFVVAERARRFPPSARNDVDDDSVYVAA